MRIKLVSWNVNGLRAVSAKAEWRWFTENDAQVVALQETKALPEQLAPEVASPQGWQSHWASSTVKKGYSGVAVFSRLTPLAVRCELFDAFVRYAEACRKEKPVVVCGDFNIAHRPIDLARPRQNEKNTGFLPEERAFLDSFTALGYVDTFRHVHGDEAGRYSWWSYKTRAREKNIGWRIDYFFVSEELRPAIADAWIEDGVYGSDHCPVGLALDVGD